MAETPLLEPAVLISDNCPRCQGTGEMGGRDCDDCEGSGRIVSETPLSIAYVMIQDASARATAPPPSALRERGAAG